MLLLLQTLSSISHFPVQSRAPHYLALIFRGCRRFQEIEIISKHLGRHPALSFDDITIHFLMIKLFHAGQMHHKGGESMFNTSADHHDPQHVGAVICTLMQGYLDVSLAGSTQVISHPEPTE